LRFAAGGPLFRAPDADLTEVEGIDVGTALVVLAETGVLQEEAREAGVQGSVLTGRTPILRQ
jgi:hypothetical protein